MIRQILWGLALFCWFSSPLIGDTAFSFKVDAPVRYTVTTKLNIDQRFGEEPDGVSMLQELVLDLRIVPPEEGVLVVHTFPVEVEVTLRRLEYTAEKNGDKTTVKAIDGELSGLDPSILGQLDTPFRMQVDEGLVVAKDFQLGYLLGLLPESSAGDGKLFDRLVLDLVKQVFVLAGEELEEGKNFKAGILAGLELEGSAPIPAVYQIENVRPARITAKVAKKRKPREIVLVKAEEMGKDHDIIAVVGAELKGVCNWDADSSLMYGAHFQYTIDGMMTHGQRTWPVVAKLTNTVTAKKL